MKLQSATFVDGPEGPSLLIVVDPPLTETCNTILIPRAALADRRLAYGVTTADRYEPGPPDEDGEPGEPVLVEAGTETGCACGECDLCATGVDFLLAEQFARANPDQLDRLDPKLATRFVELGGVPGKTLDEKGQIADVVVAEPQPAAVRATGALIREAP